MTCNIATKLDFSLAESLFSNKSPTGNEHDSWNMATCFQLAMTWFQLEVLLLKIMSNSTAKTWAPEGDMLPLAKPSWGWLLWLGLHLVVDALPEELCLGIVAHRRGQLFLRGLEHLSQVGKPPAKHGLVLEVNTREVKQEVLENKPKERVLRLSIAEKYGKIQET